MDEKELENYLSDYDKLCHEMTDLLNGKDLNIVLPALAFMLASGGQMQGMSKETLIAAMTVSIFKVYADAESTEEELIH